MKHLLEAAGDYYMPRPSVMRTGAPERVYDEEAADPDWQPRPVGFLAPITAAATELEPLLWEGDSA